MNEASVRAEPAGEVVDRLIASHGFCEPFSAIFLCCSCCELALVVRLERDAIGIHLCEIARRFRRIDSGIEVGEVPLRKLAGLARRLRGRRFGGLCLEDGFLGGWLAESRLFQSR